LLFVVVKYPIKKVLIKEHFFLCVQNKKENECYCFNIKFNLGKLYKKLKNKMYFKLHDKK